MRETTLDGFHKVNAPGANENARRLGRAPRVRAEAVRLAETRANRDSACRKGRLAKRGHLIGLRKRLVDLRAGISP